jgi:phosphate transport system substrate-binding protein
MLEEEKMRKLTILIMVLTLAVSFFAGCKKGEGENGEPKQIVVTGSTTVLPVMQKVAEDYMGEYPDVDISVSGGGSGNGIAALIDGTCDIAMTSRDIKDKEKTRADEKGLDIEEVEIAYDGIAVVLHPSNSVSALTKDQIHDIYAGKIKNWKEVGGPDLEIVVISRDTSSGTYEMFNEKILGEDPLREDALMQASNAAVRSAIAGSEGAIGYIGFGYLDNTVKTITVDGVEATIENVASGKYPISRALNLYHLKEPADGVKELINYILADKGQKIVEELGYIPL